MNNWCWNVLTSPTLILIAQWTVRMTAEIPNASITARQMKNSRLKGSQMRGEWGFQEWTTCCGWRAPWWSCGGCGAWRSSSSPQPPPLSPLWLAGGREPASGFLKLYSQDFTFSNFTFSSFHRKSLHYHQGCWFDRVSSLRSFKDIPNNKNFLRENLAGHKIIHMSSHKFLVWIGWELQS